MTLIKNHVCLPVSFSSAFDKWKVFHMKIMSYNGRLVAVIFLQLAHIMVDGIWYLSWMFLDSSIHLSGFHWHFFGKPWLQLTKQLEITWGMDNVYQTLLMLNINLIVPFIFYIWKKKKSEILLLRVWSIDRVNQHSDYFLHDPRHS